MTGKLRAVTGADLLEQRMQATFGMGRHDYKVNSHGRIPTAYLGNAIRIVDRSGVVEQLEAWRLKARKSNAGRKPYIPFRAVLILFLLHVQQALGVNYIAMAKTLDVRCSLEHFQTLGIRNVPGDQDDWYQRLWQASNRMLALIDPYPIPRHTILRDPQDWARLKGSLETETARQHQQAMLERLDWVCNQFVVASVGLLPRDLWNKYEGNMALDATKQRIAGAPNSAVATDKRANLDALSGRYRREGSHDGKGAKTDVAAYELEAACMVWNKPGQHGTFPSLITAVSFHKPGSLAGHGLKLIQQHKKYGFDRFLVLADRAYPHGKVAEFQLPLRKLGCELVIDYDKDEVGEQGSYGNLMLVDGNWYTNTMPQRLIDATKSLVALKEAEDAAETELFYAARRAGMNTDTQLAAIAHAEEQLAEAPDLKERLYRVIDNRLLYRMTPKGRPDTDGYQRFTYPDGYQPTPTDIGGGARTITIPPLIPEHKLNTNRVGKNSKSKKRSKLQPLKHLQKFQYESPEWRAYYGMRSHIENHFKLAKHHDTEDFGNPLKRSGHGYSSQYLAATLAMVSSNIRAIISFFTQEAATADGGVLKRVRRRKDEHGSRLPESDSSLALAPPA